MKSWLNRFSKQKIFVIGFNKTGTRTLHNFFLKNHIRSGHWMFKHKNIAVLMSDNLSRGFDILHRLERFTAFSDLMFCTDDVWLEGNKYFRELHQAYPDAYFIFNDRPVEKWIKSRCAHETYFRRARNYHGVSGEEVCDIWRRQYAEHRQAVLDYAPNIRRFLHFQIESDGFEALQRFLGDSFHIESGTYEVVGTTATKQPRKKSRTLPK